MRFALNTGVFRNESGGKLFEIGEITGWEEQDRYGNITKYRKTLHYVINNEGLIVEFDGYCLKRDQNKMEIQPTGTISIEKI